MVEIDVQSLVDLFKDSIGVDAAEKIVYEALKNANLTVKQSYSEEEFSNICEVLKKKGGFIKTIATVASASAYSDSYYQKELTREREEKEDLAKWKYILEQEVQKRVAELKIAEERFRQIAISSGDWIWEVDALGAYTYSSSVVKDLLGYEPEEITGKQYSDFFIPQEKERLASEVNALFAQKERILRLVNENLHKDGYNVILETSAMPILDGNGNLLGYRGVNRDITERKHAEEELNNAYNKLKETQAQLVQSAKMAAVGQLGAGVAHELNNPLGGILGYAQFILEKIKQPDFGAENFKSCQRYIETIERESTRCKKIVETLLTFSRRPISAKPEPVDINRAVEEVIFVIGHQLKLNNVEVITDFMPDLVRVSGIINQLQQVFTNLILNAGQAMPDGGELRITAQNLIDEPSQVPSKVKIAFADTGCGISPENLTHVFEPFFTTKAKEKGTGLGLSLSYQIIQDHKGKLEVKSEVGKGTVFTIILPACRPAGLPAGR